VTTDAAHAALPSFEPTALIGQILDGRYLVTAHLATGGMGAVLRAQHVYMRKDVAIKVLRPDLSASSDLVERFRREAEIIAALEHENIVRVSDFGRSPEGYLFLVMELLEGESLFERLRREGSMPAAEAVAVLWQVCAALEAAHARGVVHRDLKPENVFLARTGGGREVVKILDFGIAKIGDPQSASSTAAGMVVGTPEYLSPEQALGGDVDTRADLYSVGLIAWRMLVGRHPFKAGDPRALLMMQATQPVPPISEPRPELAEYPQLVAAVARACEKEVSRRTQTAAAMKLDFGAALPGFVPPAGPTPVPPGATPSPSMPPVVPLAAARPRPVPAPAVTGPTFDLAPPASPPPAPSATPTLTPRWRLRRDLAAARLRAWALLARETVRGAAVRGGALARRRPAAAAAVAGAVLVAIAVAIAASRAGGRAEADAREHLAAGRPADARKVLESALRRHPEDPELRLLLGRALHRIPGEAAAGVDAYAAALETVPLDEVALADLASNLAGERSLADRAGRLLLRIGEPAVPSVLAAVGDTKAPGVKRLRALALARDLGAEEKVDRETAYASLLADPECDVRRAAARRLGEIGGPAALPPLREAAAARKETKGFFGSVQRTPVCGAAEAAEAVRRIEAAAAPAKPPAPIAPAPRAKPKAARR
jgi:serine/threonine-protein kinase